MTSIQVRPIENLIATKEFEAKVMEAAREYVEAIAKKPPPPPLLRRL